MSVSQQLELGSDGGWISSAVVWLRLRSGLLFVLGSALRQDEDIEALTEDDLTQGSSVR